MLLAGGSLFDVHAFMQYPYDLVDTVIRFWGTQYGRFIGSFYVTSVHPLHHKRICIVVSEYRALLHASCSNSSNIMKMSLQDHTDASSYQTQGAGDSRHQTVTDRVTQSVDFFPDATDPGSSTSTSKVTIDNVGYLCGY